MAGAGRRALAAGATRRGTYLVLDGQEELRKALKSLNIEAIREAKPALADGASEIESGAKARVRVLSGKTRDSITTKFFDSGLTVNVGSGYFNARFEEFGTQHKSAKPFLFPAFESARSSIIARLSRALNTAIKRVDKV